jgi:hypothetical protein
MKNQKSQKPFKVTKSELFLEQEKKLPPEIKKEIEFMKKRILSYMLYKGYVGEHSINEDELSDKMLKEGWLDLSDIQIASLLRNREREENGKM